MQNLMLGMRKHIWAIFTLIVALFFVLSLAACGSSEQAEDQADAISVSSDSEDESDWRSSGVYVDEYPLTDTYSIYLVDTDGGYDVYLHSSDDDVEPAYLAAVCVTEKETGYTWDDMTGEALTEDIDDDDIRELGLTANNGNILWYGISPDEDSSPCTYLGFQYTESGETELVKDRYPEAAAEDFDLAVEDLPEYVPDILNIRENEYDDMPYFDSQDDLSEYVLWNYLYGNTEFECRLSMDLSYDLTAYALYLAGQASQTYYLFGSYRYWSIYTEDDGDPDSVYANITIILDDPDLDLEAQAEALEYVMKNPVPIGGFTGYEEEMEYARGIHDYIACKVTYDPRGYDPVNLLGDTSFDALQEAYNSLAEDQNSVVCAGYARGFALIAQYAGINCAWMMGNETDSESHAWNVIYPCDGSDPVLVDVTWDDTSSVDEPGQTEVSDMYFYVPLSLSEDYDHLMNEDMASFMQYLNGY